MKIWYAVALSAFLITLLSIVEYFLAQPLLLPDPHEAVRYLVGKCMLAASVLLALVALFVHGFRFLRKRQ